MKLRKPIENKPYNIIQIEIKTIKLPKQNLKKQVKLTMFFLIRREKQIMISLDMRLLREDQEEAVFQTSIFRVLFPIYLVQISLMTFLMDLVVKATEDKEDLQIKEDLI